MLENHMPNINDYFTQGNKIIARKSYRQPANTFRLCQYKVPKVYKCKNINCISCINIVQYVDQIEINETPFRLNYSITCSTKDVIYAINATIVASQIFSTPCYRCTTGYKFIQTCF